MQNDCLIWKCHRVRNKIFLPAYVRKINCIEQFADHATAKVIIIEEMKNDDTCDF